MPIHALMWLNVHAIAKIDTKHVIKNVYVFFMSQI